MNKIMVFVILAICFCGVAGAVEVPAVTPLDFAVSPEAHPVWLALAGEGFWGLILVYVVRLLYKWFRPAIVAWVEERRLGKLYFAAEACVTQINAVYVEGMKKANADGKLTEDEKQFVFKQSKAALVRFMNAQGIDVIKEFGDVAIDAIIELVVSRLKNPLAKAAAVPLSGSSVSAPLPLSVTEGATPA